jgi:hypothetical protein
MLKILPVGTSDVDEELCAFVTDRQKAFDRVNWTKLMQILRETGS